MIFRLILATLLLCVPASAANVPPNESPSTSIPSQSLCPGSVTKSEFFKNIKGTGWQVYTLSPSGAHKLVTKINLVRSKNNAELLPADTQVYFSNIGEGRTGLMFSSGICVIKGSVMSFPSAVVADLFLQSGILDSDYIKVVNT